MVKHILNKATNSTWEIDTSGDSWVLGKAGKISGAGISGIHAADTIDAATITVNGAIAVTGASSGLDLYAKNSTVAIGETGRIEGMYAVYYENYGGSFTLDNDGLLLGEYGISAGAAQNSADIANTGKIHADFGITIAGAGARIVNSGSIKSDFVGVFVGSGAMDADPLVAGNATDIVNTGKITGSEASVHAFGVAVNIRNKGVLNGDVSLTNGDDTVNTKGGTINGDVSLGDGDDVFKGAGGTLNGILHGGAGNDVVTLASPATLYVEYLGEGTDTVRVNSTYILGENIENLTLLGKANHTGIGNGLNNVLTGNKGANTLYGQGGFDELDGGRGNDRLSGGAGVDVFVFRAGYGVDTIMDFEDGTDILAGFGDYLEVKDKIFQKGDDVVIRLTDTDRLIIRDMLASDIDASDFPINI